MKVGIVILAHQKRNHAACVIGFLHTRTFLLFFLFLRHALFDFIQQMQKIVFLHRLENIFHTLQANCFLCARKVADPAQKDKACIRDMVLPYFFQEFNSIHLRHSDIRNNQVNRFAAEKIDGLKPVFRRSRYKKALFFPFDNFSQALKNKRLIIHQKDFQHNSSLPLLACL